MCMFKIKAGFVVSKIQIAVKSESFHRSTPNFISSTIKYQVVLIQIASSNKKLRKLEWLRQFKKKTIIN